MEEQFGDWETEESPLILNPDFINQTWLNNKNDEQGDVKIIFDSITIEEVSQ